MRRGDFSLRKTAEQLTRQHKSTLRPRPGTICHLSRSGPGFSRNAPRFLSENDACQLAL